MLFLLLPDAGSGGGGTAAPSKAVVTLSAQGTVSTPNFIHGIELYLVLPVGVTVKTDTTGKPTDGIVVATGGAAGANTTVLAKYPVTEPVEGNANAIFILLTDTAGFDPGNFVTVTCDITSGSSPKQADFKVTGFKPVDSLSGAVINDLIAVSTVDIY